MKQFLAWVVVVVVLVSKTSAVDDYLADRVIDKKPAGKHRNSALAGGQEAIAWQNYDEKIGQLRGSTTAVEKTFPATDGVKQGEVSAVVLPWDSVTSTTPRHYSTETPSRSTTESSVSKVTGMDGQTGVPNYNQNAPTKAAEISAHRNKYSPATSRDALPAEAADVLVPWGGAASRSAESYERRRGESTKDDSSPKQHSNEDPSDEKWRKSIGDTHQRDSGLARYQSYRNEGQKLIENKAGLPQEPEKTSVGETARNQETSAAYDKMVGPSFPSKENSTPHKQDTNDKNGNPLTGSQPGKQANAPYSVSDEAKHEEDVAVVGTSWETRASKSSDYSNTKSPSSESARYEKPTVYHGALAPITPWSGGKTQLMREPKAEKPTQTQQYSHLLGDVVPWSEASSLFARGLQSEPENQQTGEAQVKSDESGEHVEIIKEEEDGVMTTMTVTDENVRWNQDDCNPCDVPTQSPTLAPLYPRESDDYEKHLPIVVDENESWEYLKESLPPSIPTKTPDKKPTNPYEDEFSQCTKVIGNYGESYECTTESPTPAPTKTPNDKTCIDVSVEGDATYCIQGPICSGSGSAPAGSLCPIKGDFAVQDCNNEKLPSWTSTDKCVAPVDATCSKVKTGAWGCVYGETSNSTDNSTQSPTPAPAKTPNDKTCINVSVEGDATYCIQGPICSGSDSTPVGSLCPIKGDVAVEDCNNDKLPSWTSGICVAPVDATCSKIKNGAWRCVFGDSNGETETPTQQPTEIPSKTPTATPFEPTSYPTEPETATPKPSETTPAPSQPNEPNESTPAPSKPSEQDEPTPAPSQPSEVTPTNSYDEPVPTPATSTTEHGTSTSSHPNGKSTSSSTTTKPATSNTTTGTSSSSKPISTSATKTSTSTGNNAYTNTGTSGADANVAGASTSTGTTSSGASGVLSGGAIAGIIIACIVFVAIIVGAVLIRQRSIARQREENLFAELSGTGGRSFETDYAAM